MEYPRREGCDDQGVDYEHLITALFSLRFAFLANLEEFWIASNVNYVGDCDDIVMSIKSTKGDKLAFLIQLKHMETEKKLQPEHFTYSRENKEGKRAKEKEKFSIEKYWRGFEQFQKRLADPEEKSEFIKELREADNTILILFTNRGVDDCSFLKKSDLDDNFFDLLDTNDINYCYGFDYAQLPSYKPTFLEKLRLFGSQLHADNIIYLMKTEIQKCLNLVFPSMIDFDEVAIQYMQYVKAWIKGYKIGKETKFYTLTKPDVLKTLAGILLNSYKYDFSKEKFTSYMEPPKTIWNEIVSDKDVTLLNKNESIVQFIEAYYGSEVRKFVPKPPTMWNELLSRSTDKEFKKQFGHAKVVQVCQNSELSMLLIYKTLWMDGSVPLLLHFKNSKQFKDILKILKVCEHLIKVIVLVKDSAEVKFKRYKLNYFVTFQDLTSQQQRTLLGVEVNFQGRTSVPLNSLVDKTLYSIIKCHDVIDIVSEEFVVGSKFEKMFAYFIHRSMSRVLLRFEVLELPNETFLIETKDAERARDRLKVYINKPALVHFINFDELHHMQKFVGQNAHRLVYGEGNLEWKESAGNITSVQSYVISSNEHKNYELMLPSNLENFLKEKSINETKILSAGPGMGKSIMLDFVALFAPKDVWVVNIKLSHSVLLEKPSANKKSLRDTNSTPTYFDSDISDASSDDDDIFESAYDAVKVFERLLIQDEQITTCKISLAVFRKFYKANKILILLDGFDEISIDHKSKVTNFIQLLQRKQHAVWITTRDHMRSHLEESLKTLASTLKPFTRDEQKTFLINYFNANIEGTNEPIVVEFADRLLIAAAENLSTRDDEFTGIPLQTKLLADVFLKKCEKSCQSNVIEFTERFDLLKLYDKFIKQKNKILVQKFGPNEKTWSKNKSLVNAQKYLALQHVFAISAFKCSDIDVELAPYYKTVGKQFIQRGGILVVHKSKRGAHIEFVHRTFAEYLAAKYLSENISNSNDLIRTNILELIKVRFDAPGTYQFLFLVFDRIVAENNSLHLSIINNKDDYLNFQIDKDPNLLLECDDLERSGLHLLALYEKEFSEEQLRKILKKIKTFKISQLIATDLLGYSVLEYCLIFHSWIIADFLCKTEPYFLLNLHPSFQADITGEHALKNFFHNFCISRLLIGKIYEDSLITECVSLIAHNTLIPTYKLTFFSKLQVISVKQYFELVGIKETNANKYSDIRFAVALGDIENVKNLLDCTNVDINKKDCNNDASLVHYAIYNHRYDILEELLHRGGDLNLPDCNGNTAVHLLALDGAFELLVKFLDNIVNYKAKNDIGETPLDVALRLDQYRAKKYFIRNYDQINRSEKLYYAALLGDNETLLKLLESGCNINYQSDNNKTALHAALEHNHIDCANLLIDRNINLSLSINQRESFLHLVAKTGNRELFEKLLSKGLNINRQNEFGETPLIVAIKHGRAELAEYILSRGADVSIRSKYGSTLTHAIVRCDKEEVLSSILDGGCSMKDIYNGATSLNLALAMERPNIARLLLKKMPSADITAADNLGATPLHYAAEYGWTDLVIDFLNEGMSTDVQNKHNETPLLLALRWDCIRVAEILLNNNANVLLEDNNGHTPLHYAAAAGDTNIIQKILDKGGEVNKFNNGNITPFLWALSLGNDEAVNLLLEHKGDLTKEYLLGNSSLHLAAETGNNEIVQKCLNLNIDVDIKNDEQDTPLFLAVTKNHLETARLLIDNGADVFQTDRYNSTILHNAFTISHKEFILQILDMNVDVNAVNDFGATPLCIALFQKELGVAKLLLSRGAKLDTICKNKCSILHLAALSNFDDLLLECLSKNIFDINLEDVRGDSPLEYGLKEQSLVLFCSSAKLLLKRGAHVKSRYIYTFCTTYLTKNQTEEELTEAFGVLHELVRRCNDLNELDENKNTLLVNLFTNRFKSSLNNVDFIWFCKICNLLLDTGADRDIKGNRYRSANEMFQDAFEDTNAMSDEQRKLCLKMGLVSRLMT